MLLDFLKKKLVSFIETANIIDGTAIIGKNCYVSGSRIHGKVTISESCKVFQSYLEGNIHIGRYTSLWGSNIAVISHIHPITIGSFCSIARNVCVFEDFHYTNRFSTYLIHTNLFGDTAITSDRYSKGSVEIGNDVWIGAGAVIMSGVKIGNGAVIGANSVITKDVTPYSIVAGNPAKQIRLRFNEDVISRLQELKWWEWEIERIKANKHLFDVDLNSKAVDFDVI